MANRSRRGARLPFSFVTTLAWVGVLAHGMWVAARTQASWSAAAQSGEIARGRTANRPSDIPAPGWKDIPWRTWHEISEDRVLAIAAGVTFYALLAMFPALAAFVSLYGLFADAATISDHISGLSAVLPSGTLDIVGDQIKRVASQSNGSLGVGLITGIGVSLWSANAGMKALFDALNVVYDEQEKRSYIVLSVWSLAFTLGAIAISILAMVSVVVVPAAFAWLGIGGGGAQLVAAARWPVLLIAVMLALRVLYRYGPSRRSAQWRWITPGSAIASLAWLLVSLAFSYYVANFANYNATYGSLGAVVGLMTWIWISVAIVLVGAEINAEAEHQTARDSTIGTPKPMDCGATMADTVGQTAAE